MKDKTMRIVLLCSLGAGKRNSRQTQRVVGEHNIFGETLSQALGGSKITVTTLCPGTDRYWNGSRHTSLGSMPSMMIMDAKSTAC